MSTTNEWELGYKQGLEDARGEYRPMVEALEAKVGYLAAKIRTETRPGMDSMVERNV